MRTKLFYKVFLFASIIASALCGSMPVSAASFNMTRSSSEVAPGASFTVSIGGDCIGRVNLSASGGTISQSMIWVEENYQTVSVTAGNSGTVTVTATPESGFSDPDGNEFRPGSRSVSVKIVAPSQPTQDKPSTPNTPSGTTTTKPQATNNKPQTSTTPNTPSTETPVPEISAPTEDPTNEETPTAEDETSSDENTDSLAPTNPCQAIENSNKLAWTLVGVFALLFCGVTITLVCIVFTSKSTNQPNPKQDKKVTKHEKNR